MNIINPAAKSFGPTWSRNISPRKSFITKSALLFLTLLLTWVKAQIFNLIVFRLCKMLIVGDVIYIFGAKLQKCLKEWLAFSKEDYGVKAQRMLLTKKKGFGWLRYSVVKAECLVKEIQRRKAEPLAAFARCFMKFVHTAAMVTFYFNMINWNTRNSLKFTLAFVN